ncbi:MAG: hypothetical protein ACJ8BW_33975 [Ktedonobacteraceae bacterium]
MTENREVEFPPPCGRASPPGHSVVYGCCRDERTRDTPQSDLRALVSSAKPTPGVQVVRPAAPTASTRSLLMPTEQGLTTPDGQSANASIDASSSFDPNADDGAPA